MVQTLWSLSSSLSLPASELTRSSEASSEPWIVMSLFECILGDQQYGPHAPCESNQKLCPEGIYRVFQSLRIPLSTVSHCERVKQTFSKLHCYGIGQGRKLKVFMRRHDDVLGNNDPCPGNSKRVKNFLSPKRDPGWTPIDNRAKNTMPQTGWQRHVCFYFTDRPDYAKTMLSAGIRHLELLTQRTHLSYFIARHKLCHRLQLLANFGASTETNRDDWSFHPSTYAVRLWNSKKTFGSRHNFDYPQWDNNVGLFWNKCHCSLLSVW